MTVDRLIHDIAQLEYTFFVVNTYAAGIQQNDGRYITKYFPMSPFVIEHMLLKHGSMGCYQQGYRTNRIKWICFDFDCKDKVNPDVYTMYRQCVAPFIYMLDEIGINYLTEFSGRRGIHVWIIFKTLVTKDLGFRIVCELEKRCGALYEIRENEKWGLDRFPATDSSRNNIVGKQVKFPLSCHRSGARSYFFIGEFREKNDTDSEQFLNEQLDIMKCYSPNDMGEIAEKLNLDISRSDVIALKYRRYHLLGKIEITIDQVIGILSETVVFEQIFRRMRQGLSLHQDWTVLLGTLYLCDSNAQLVKDVFRRFPNYDEKKTCSNIEKLGERYFPATFGYLYRIYGIDMETSLDESETGLHYLLRKCGLEQNLLIQLENLNENVTVSDIRFTVNKEKNYLKENDEVPDVSIWNRLCDLKKYDLQFYDRLIRSVVKGEVSKYTPTGFKVFERIESPEKKRILVSLSAKDRVITTNLALRLREIYNILFEHYLVKKIDGSFQPINPFCCNDATVVKGHLKDKNGKCYDREHFLDALLRYRSSALKVSNKCVMNRVSFGLAILLLQKENTGVDALQLDELEDGEWFQSQLLKNWAERCKDSIEALTYITERWQKENDYCIRRSNKRKNSEGKNIEDHEIEALDFYPLKSKMDWIYLMMGCENPDKVYVLHGKVQEDDDGDLFLGTDLTYDICGKKFSQNTGQTTLTVNLESVEDPDGLFENVWGSGEEYYFLYDSKKQKGIVYEQSLLKMLSAIERIQEKNQLTLETVSKICKTQYNEVLSMMSLQEEALCEAGKNVFCDFDSQVYYRLVHNLLWAGINKDNISSYLRVFMHHQKLVFKDIVKDEKFMRKDVNTLYVPKDGRKSDSVLTSIYEKYLKLKGIRESNDLYDDELEIRKDGYYHNENYIKNIVFLCDNFEAGNATIRMLKAYLNIDMSSEEEIERKYVESAKARRQKYYLKKRGLANCSDVLSQAPEQGEYFSE